MTKISEDTSGFYSNTYEIFDKYTHVHIDAWKHLAELQLNFTGLWQECLNAHLQRLSTTQNPADIFAVESGLASEYSAKFSENLRQTFNILSKTQSEFMDCFSNNGKLFADVIQSQEDTTEITKTKIETGKGPSRKKEKAVA